MSSAIASAADAMRRAFIERDFSLAAGTLAENVVLHSPVLERTWSTKAVVERLGPAMMSVFEDIRFAPVITDGDAAVVSFKARCGPVDAQLIEVLYLDDRGKVAELTLYIRPLPALRAVARAMQARVDPDLLAAHRSVTSAAGQP